MDRSHFDTLYPDNTHSADLQKLAGLVKEGNSCQLISIPGVGRSTILNLLTSNKKIRDKHFEPQLNIHFVLVNFSEVRKRPLFDVMKFLFLSLSDSLRERKKDEYQKINALLKESLGFDDELVLFQALKEAVEYLSLEKKLKIVFLFDRFEEYVPTVTSEFFTNLRTLRSRSKYQFAVVFALNRPLEALVDQAVLSDFYEFVAGQQICLSIFDQVTTDFRIEHLQEITGKKLPPKMLSQIIELSGGVGRLIKLSAEATLSRTDKENNENLAEFLFSQQLIKAALGDICRSLLPVEQNVLIQGKFDDRLAVEYLEKVGILKDNKIQIPLFAQHIKEHAEQQKELEKIIYDENTQVIKKGETILSDQLTSSEFRMLLYFLQNSDRVVEREAMIDVVWSSLKSTAGITDQAVDQLIFRLRRKIEDDPNNPSHLLTVKGRGFRFIS